MKPGFRRFPFYGIQRPDSRDDTATLLTAPTSPGTSLYIDMEAFSAIGIMDRLMGGTKSWRFIEGDDCRRPERFARPSRELIYASWRHPQSYGSAHS